MSGTLQFRHLCLRKTPSDYPGHWVGVNHLDGTNYLGILKRKTGAFPFGDCFRLPVHPGRRLP
jgi:hypothetical protein